jgi:hypothetical protein
MTDFLTRLAARARGEPSLVRPAIAPLFRPLVAAADVADDASGGDALVPAPRPVADSAAPPPRDATAPRSSIAPDAASTTDVAPDVRRVDAPDHAPFVSIRDPAPPLEVHAGAAPLRVPAAAPDEAPRRLAPPTPPAARPAPARVVRDAPVAPAPNPRAVPALERLRTLGEVTRVAHERPAEPASSVVRVTIGRVEVRTVPQAAPPAPRGRATPPRPEPSLADYLAKQRDRRP